MNINKCMIKLSWNDNWILIFICFMGRLLLEPSTSSSSSFIISYPNAKMDKRFFKNWVLHIPHCLRHPLWIVKSWSSFAPIFFSLIMSRASSCVRSAQSLLKVITSFWHIFLEIMNPMILGGHSRWLSQHLHSLLLHPLLQVVIWFERPLQSMTVWSLHSVSSHSTTVFSKSFSNLCSSL